jgi:hypothetical protein
MCGTMNRLRLIARWILRDTGYVETYNFEHILHMLRSKRKSGNYKKVKVRPNFLPVGWKTLSNQEAVSPDLSAVLKVSVYDLSFKIELNDIRDRTVYTVTLSGTLYGVQDAARLVEAIVANSANMTVDDFKKMAIEFEKASLANNGVTAKVVSTSRTPNRYRRRVSKL